MGRRTKFLVIVVAAILVLTVGLTTVAFASGSSGEEGSGNKGPMQTFVSKVASILGLEEEQVADAFEQARQKMQDEAMEQRLQEAVESGRITQEQADQIEEWWQSRPAEALEEFGQLGHHQLRNGWRHGSCKLPLKVRVVTQIFDERLNGTITSISEETKTITLTTEEGNEVTFEYTSNTTFTLRGVTTIEEGQTAIAWCWEDNEGNLTAKIVVVGLP